VIRTLDFSIVEWVVGPPFLQNSFPNARVPWMYHKFKKRVARTPVKSTGQALGRVKNMNQLLDNFYD